MRSREGLAYSVGGGFSMGLDHPGVFVASGDTSAPARFIAAVRSVLAGEDPPADPSRPPAPGPHSRESAPPLLADGRRAPRVCLR